MISALQTVPRVRKSWFSVMLKERLTRWLIPLVRGYIRHVPITPGKRLFWTTIVDPYYAWHSHKFVARTVFGVKMAGDTVDIIQQYIYYFGVWEPHLTRWIAQRLTPGDTFIDVGANIGYYSLLASTIVGESGAVLAIEASPKNFSALQSNLIRNRVRNVRAVNVAASDSEGVARLFHGPQSNAGLTTILEEQALKQDFEFESDVTTAPLSVILQPQEIERARLMKIDVEGAEWLVAAGMGPLLGSGRADLEVMIEVNPDLLAQQGKQAEDLLRIFLDAGFHAYALENDYSPLGYLPPHTAKRPERLRTPIQSETDIIFSRQDTEHL